ncbi:MAG: TrkA C-terminal domain-containing protein, partial [Halobacteriaceae archaeon]
DLAEDLQVVQFTVTEDASMNGYSISELELPSDARILAFAKRGEALEIPLPNKSLEVGDRVTVLSTFEALDDVRKILVGDDSDRQKITGGQ